MWAVRRRGDLRRNQPDLSGGRHSERQRVPTTFFCTGDETCQNGSCASAGDPCTSGSCDEPSDQCLMAGCEAAPLAGCRTALKSIFLVKDQTDNNKDKLIWKWIKGEASSQPDFANPQLTADYTLCIYSGPGENLIGEAVVPPSSSKWTPISTKGYKYKDPGRIEDGIQKIILKGGAANKSKALVKGKGVDLPDLPPASNSSLDIDLPVRVQLVNEDNGICFEGTYGAGAIKRTARQLGQGAVREDTSASIEAPRHRKVPGRLCFVRPTARPRPIGKIGRRRDPRRLQEGRRLLHHQAAQARRAAECRRPPDWKPHVRKATRLETAL
jgi:hypothetical protein